MNTASTWLIAVNESSFTSGLFVAKVTILLSMAWLIHALLRSANPRWRVLLWRASGVAVVLLLVLTASPPLIPWAVLPPEPVDSLGSAAPASDVRSVSFQVHEAAINPSIAQGKRVASSSRTVRPLPNESNQSELTSTDQHDNPSPLMAANNPAESEATRVATTAPQTRSSDILAVDAERAKHKPAKTTAEGLANRLFSLSLVVWFFGALIMCLWMAGGLLRLRSMVQRSLPGPAWIEVRAAALREQLGCTRRFELLQTPELASPCLVGMWRPVVLLPVEQCSASREEELTAILAHEIAHLKNHDVPWNWCLHALAMLLWFHPLTWRIRTAHAEACDSVADAVAAEHMGDVVSYGRTLARLAVRMHVVVPAGALMMTRSSHVRRRIEALRHKLFRSQLSRPRVLTVLTLGGVAIALLGSVALTRAQQSVPRDTASTGGQLTDPEQRPKAKSETSNVRPQSGKDKDQVDAQQDQLTVHATLEPFGHPLAGVKFRFHGRIGGERFDRQIETDEAGIATIQWTKGAKVDNLWMTGSKASFVPIHYTWRSEHRAIELPEELHLSFRLGQTIGGILQDDDGRPIPGATVDVTMPIDWPKLANHVFTAAGLTTDAAGRWSWTGAPEDLGSLSVRVTHPDYIRGWGHASTNLDTVAVLEQGLQVTGHVLTADGQPVEGAKARLGFDRFGTSEPETTTDANGRFVVKNCKAGKSLVTVQAEGFAPQLREITVGEQEDSGEFRLQPGLTLRVRVMDQAGNPVQGAIVVTDTWRGYRTLELRTTTDEEGRVHWHSAPEDSILCDVLKTGFMSVRKVPLQASSEEQVITIPQPLVIRGAVTDAATGQPIPEFKIRVGHDYTGRDIYWSRDEGVAYKNGTYQFEFDEPINGAYLLQVIAPLYLPATSRPLRMDEGSVEFDFALQAGHELSGTVVTASGEPAAEAEVGLATVESRAMLDNGYFDRSQNSAEVVKTDASGRFSFLPQGDEPFLLIALHPSGFAEITHEQFKDSTKLRLKPWGRIEGQVLVGDLADANREVAFWPKRPDRKGMFVFSYGYQTTTDAEGRFEFDRAIPGSGTVSRVVVTAFLDSWQHAPGWQKPVEITPNETTHVIIGGTGRKVVGQVKLDRQPDVVIDWTTNEPATIERWDAATDSRHKDYFRCLGNIDKNGRFEIPDVPPGYYQLSIPVNNPPSTNSCGAGDMIGQAKHQFTVAPEASPRNTEPQDVGVIIAELFDTLDPGELAPDFVAEKLAGGPLRLSDLHGKLVVLDFWATWCGPCLAEMPTLKEIHRQFGGDERLVVLNLSCDNQLEAPLEYVRQNSLDWMHAHVSGMQAAPLRDYTVRALPATFLIGPDGRVMAKNLRGEALKQAVAAALKDDTLFENAASTDRPPRFPVVKFEPSEISLSAVPALVVLDNCDPGYQASEQHTDGLHLLSADGKQLSVLRTLNNSGTVGGHGVSVDAGRRRIFVRENAINRLSCFDFHGRKRWQVDGIQADTLAVDPKTGHIWCSGGRLLSQGETIVLDQSGREITAYPYRAIDLAYDPHTDSFWLVGYEILKLNRQGEVLFRKPVEGWCCSSVSVDPTNGAVWFIEREHQDVVKSSNRLWKLDAAGALLVDRNLGEQLPFAVECDAQSGRAWVATLNDGLRQFSRDGEPTAHTELKAYNLAMGSDGLWVATEEAVLKLDRAGKIVARYDFEQPSAQAWLAAF